MKSALISSLLTGILLLFTQCGFAGEREIPQAQQAKDLLIQKVAEALPGTDTLFVSRLNIIGVCGNGREKPKLLEKMKITYYINTSEGFQTVYRIGNRVVVVGTSFDGRFIPEGESGSQPPSVPEKSFYGLIYPKVEKNAFTVNILNGRTRDQITTLEFYRDKSGNWQAK